MKKVNKKDEGQAMWKYYKFDAITVTSIYSGVLFHLQLRACFCIYRITPFDVNNFIVNDLPKSKHISFLELKTIKFEIKFIPFNMTTSLVVNKITTAMQPPKANMLYKFY